MRGYEARLEKAILDEQACRLSNLQLQFDLQESTAYALGRLQVVGRNVL